MWLPTSTTCPTIHIASLGHEFSCDILYALWPFEHELHIVKLNKPAGTIYCFAYM